MSEQAWKASWIWGGTEESPRNEWRCFRTTFEAPEAAAAELRISADSRYVAYVNGARVGRGPVRSWPAEQFYDVHSIGHLLKPGARNTIAVLVLHFGVTNFYYLRGKGGLLAEVTANGGTLAATDGSWRTEKLAGQDPSSPRMACQQGFAEVFDASVWDGEWTDPSFDDGAWGTARVVASVGEGPWKTLVPRDIPFLTEEKLYPSRIESLQRVRPPAWTAAIDLRNAMMPSTSDHANHVSFVGYLATTLALPEAGRVILGFPSGARMGRVWVDGRSVENWTGEMPERYAELELPAGEHFVLIDVTSKDHGGSFHAAAHADVAFELRCPLGGGDTPFALVGPFDEAVHIDTEEPLEVDLEEPGYVRAAGAASMRELEALQDRVRPLDAAYYTERDVFGANVWRPVAEAYAIPHGLERALLPTPEGAALPRFADGDAEIVVDFGKQRSGFHGFELEAPAGTVIDFYGLEYMKGEYRQHTYGLDNTFRYISRGGRQRYESPVRRGCRYAVLTVRGASGPVILHEAYIVQSTYPVVDAGAFQCSDPLLNDIWDISRHTTRLCMEDTFVDCPAYEQVFWVGDSRNEALVNYYVFGALDIVKRCLRLVPGSKDETPLYMDQVPSGWKSVIPNWTFFWAIAVMEYVEHSGDRAFAAEMWPHVRFTLEHYLKHIDGDGLLNMRGWNLLDWAPIDQPKHGVVTHQNLFLAQTLRKASSLASVAGAPAGEAEPLERAASSLESAINEHLWDEAAGAYLDCIHADGRRSTVYSMQTQVVALLCGVAQGDRKERLERYLVEPPASFVQIGSPFMSFFYYEALEATGREARMLDDIRRNFGQMIDNGATTCWEMYPNFAENRANPDQLTRSHCHAWSAGPAYFLGRSVLGVRRQELGWKRIRIEPVPSGLTWARGAVPLPDGGAVEVQWKLDGNDMTLRVSAPEDVELDVRLPEGTTGRITTVRTKRLPA
jgi:hypothetical protein